MSVEIHARRVAFEYPTENLRRHFVSGDIVMSHVVAMLSAMFPDGEDFFVRSVETVRDGIADPRLRDDVEGFIGQESMHAVSTGRSTSAWPTSASACSPCSEARRSRGPAWSSFAACRGRGSWCSRASTMCRTSSAPGGSSR